MSEITWTFKPYYREVWNKSKKSINELLWLRDE